MPSKAGTWVAGALGALLYAASEIALHEATFGPNAVRVGEVLWVIVVVVLGVALAVCAWVGRRQDRWEPPDRWLQ
jgi:hypothetical protein